MTQYIIRRLFQLVPILLGITIISFMVIHLAPGKPTELMLQLNPKVDFEAREKLNQLYGLDKPIYVQYLNWIKKLMRFDFGRSFIDNRPVNKKIMERLPITILINVLALIFIFIFSIPIGIRSAVKRGSFFDKSTTVFVFLGFAMPSFWLALLLMSFLGVKLGILPVSGIVSLDFENFRITYINGGRKLLKSKSIDIELIFAFAGIIRDLSSKKTLSPNLTRLILDLIKKAYKSFKKRIEKECDGPTKKKAREFLEASDYLENLLASL